MIARYGLFGLVLVLGLGAGLRDGFDRWVAQTRLPPLLHETSVEVLARDGSLLRAFPVENGRIRLAVTARGVDPTFVAMLIAYEDKRFYTHSGVDLRAMARAGAQALWQGEAVSGASTLTMQVARLLENSGTGRWAGKWRQIRLALALERRLTKAQILELYLTHAPYGGPVEGVRAASLSWFGKEPTRLDPAEAALLIALPQSPETRRPDRFPAAARTARDRVLTRVAGRVARAALAPLAGPEGSVAWPPQPVPAPAPAPPAPTDHAQNTPQTPRADVPRKMHRFPRLAPHLADHARGQDPFARSHVTTIDAALQRQIETLARRAVFGLPEQVSSAIVVADHHSGEIRALVGAPSYGAGQGAQDFVDMTRALRSPGSALKPFVYAMAFDQGLVHPETLIKDAPVQFDGYAPQNFDGQFRGDVTVRAALHQSLNIPPVLLTRELGPARLMARLRAGGASPVVPRGQAGLAVSLGGVGLSLRDMVGLYAGLAQGGQTVRLRWRAGQAAGTDVQTAKGAARDTALQPGAGAGAEEEVVGAMGRKRLFSAVAAWQVGDILTGTPRPLGVGGQAGRIAFKTGTSYGHRDAVAFGYDGQHVVGVWLGRPDGTPVPGAFGGALAAPILFEVFSRLSPQPAPLPPPPAKTRRADTADLPPPLRRFRPREAVFAREVQPLTLLFPPDGARLRRSDAGVPLKLSDGVLPLSVLINGVPVQTGVTRRELTLALSAPGFVHIAVIDAKGRAARAEIVLE